MNRRSDGQQSQAAKPAPTVGRDGQRTQRRVRFQQPLEQDALEHTMPRGGERRRDEQKKKSETTIQRPLAMTVAAESEWGDGSQTAEPAVVTARREETGGTSRSESGG
ncbi:hypothetical protein GN958_ATG10612 [Phytophthora infestans]|uniref:Uncharacterized protein n=1 Tax=Phytophthora infestans TaxID=4787 RepID=A0A8S9UMC7_PHYIN|nr:hypothetical protein GN958_ATG10612 [Phytophthora infestans]